MDRRFLLVLSVALVGLSACGAEQGVKGAKGDTPVKHVICGANETNCFVASRYKDLDGCMRHNKWSNMLCDSRSEPGTMICKDDNPSSQVTYTYCVP